MKFQKGDKVRALRTDPWLSSLFVVGEIYTVDGHNPAVSDEIYLTELLSTGCYNENRFDLVASGSAKPTVQMPLLPTPLQLLPTSKTASIYDDIANQLYPEMLCPVVQNHKKCECGVDSIGGGKHSSYCPKS